MPPPPEPTNPRERAHFPIHGATDRLAFIDTPGDAAPFGKILNARPRDHILGRERGGQRPPVVEMRDRAGQPWGPVGDGPITAITSVALPAAVTGYKLGASKATHQKWESRQSTELFGNLWILRGKDTPRPGLSRHTSLGRLSGGAPVFEDGTLRELTAAKWWGQRDLAGGVNENPPTGDRDYIVLRASYLAGGTPTEYDSFDGNPFGWTVDGGRWPIERLAIFYGDSVLGRILFAAHTIYPPHGGPDGDKFKGVVHAYDLNTATFAASPNPSTRPFGKVFHGAAQGSVSPNPGAIEVTGLKAVIVGSVKCLYFCYNANPNSESMVGRFDVTNYPSTGLELALPGGVSGAVQTNGNSFEIHAGGNFATIPTDPLSPHLLSVNYPRGARPMDVAVGPGGDVYWVQSSAGWGPQWNGGANPSHHPDFPGHIPITVCRIDASGTRFEWETLTHVNTTESGTFRINDPELVWCEADDLGCYCGGREVGGQGANVFAIDRDTGAVRWTWSSCAAGQAARIHCGAIDPGDGHLWVAGERRTDWTGRPASNPPAHLWKLHRESGAVLAWFDLGVSVAVLSIDINPESGLVALGTQHPDQP